MPPHSSPPTSPPTSPPASPPDERTANSRPFALMCPLVRPHTCWKLRRAAMRPPLAIPWGGDASAGLWLCLGGKEAARPGEKSKGEQLDPDARLGTPRAASAPRHLERPEHAGTGRTPAREKVPCVSTISRTMRHRIGGDATQDDIAPSRIRIGSTTVSRHTGGAWERLDMGALDTAAGGIQPIWGPRSLFSGGQPPRGGAGGTRDTRVLEEWLG
jgi:hypothetical protein